MASEPIQTAIMLRMVARMQRTHERRRASFFVGPPGIGKSTAIEAFRKANANEVMVIRVLKRGVTGPQALQQLLRALKFRAGMDSPYVSNSTNDILHGINKEMADAAGHLCYGDDAELFPLLTVVFDEAQRLTNGAIDALRDYNEPHDFCRGAFPIGMIFVGNNELSLEATHGGASILDEGMKDRLLYRDRLTYDDVERGDLELFIRSCGIDEEAAVAAIGAAFAAPRAQRSFRRLADFIDEVRDEAGSGPVTRAAVQAVLALL